MPYLTCIFENWSDKCGVDRHNILWWRPRTLENSQCIQSATGFGAYYIYVSVKWDRDSFHSRKYPRTSSSIWILASFSFLIGFESLNTFQNFSQLMMYSWVDEVASFSNLDMSAATFEDSGRPSLSPHHTSPKSRVGVSPPILFCALNQLSTPVRGQRYNATTNYYFPLKMKNGHK